MNTGRWRFVWFYVRENKPVFRLRFSSLSFFVNKKVSPEPADQLSAGTRRQNLKLWDGGE
jgi:hypothetical protein